MKIRAYLIVFSLLVTGCILITNQTGEVVTPEIPPTQPTTETLPNPASAYCEQQGNTLEIHTTASGSQSGICIFPDGSECDEWVNFRGECIPANQGSSMPNPASVFCEEQGFKLEIRTADDR